MTDHIYGWRKEPDDERDLKLSYVRGIQLPDMADWRRLCSPIKNQSSLGSCTGHAIVSMREFLILKLQSTLVDLSELFLYHEELDMEGNTGIDAGAFIRDGMKITAKIGIATEESCPYIVDKFDDEPSMQAFASAAKYKISVYRRLSTLNDIKYALAKGFTCVFGFNVYESFESEAVARTGIMPMPKFGEKILGGHAVHIVGYNNLTSTLIIKNSWGKEWGDRGYFYMPYKFMCGILQRNVSDIWTAEL